MCFEVFGRRLFDETAKRFEMEETMRTLELENITKKYKNKTAVDRFTARFSNGIYGLLGANGAGKTTLLRMICNILQPTEGVIRCDGMEIGKMDGEYRALLGYLPQDFGYYPDMSAERYLYYIAALKAVPKDMAGERIQEFLQLVELYGERKRKIGTFSGGMIRRLGIAQAMLNEPDILILDEPTSGLDPKERIRFRNIISSFSKNRIVLLSTHIVSDVEYIADEILLMKKGKLIKQGIPDKITEEIDGCVWECLVDCGRVEEYNARYAVSNLKNQGDKVCLRIVSQEKPTEDASLATPNLEDVYLYYFEEGSER